MSTAPISWIVTTADAAWQQHEPVTTSPITGMPDVFVGVDDPRQSIEGFGASFNELGWTALELLDDDAREGVLRSFFEPDAGLDLTLCRMPLGANDFSRDWYSYDEVDGDLALEHFSIDNDRATLIPFIRAAKRYQPELRLWASPWSPPTWMKTNGHYAGSQPRLEQSVENGLRDDQVGHEGTDMFRLDDEYLAAYAAYFGRFIDAYAAEGIEIGMVMPQNEFNSAQVFPSCTWTPEGLARFIGHLAPEMGRRDVDVFLGTLERPNPDLVQFVVNDPVAGPALSGVGAQWAGKGALAVIHHDNPALRIYQTEQECGDGLNDWRYARYAWTIMKQFFANGASAYMYWNMALLEGGVSRWGWAQNSLVVVDPETRTVRYTHEYHLLRHVSGAVAVGARVLPTVSYTGFENQLAFVNPDGSIVLVAHNDLGHEQSVSYLLGDRFFEAVLPADSFSTFVIPAV